MSSSDLPIETKASSLVGVEAESKNEQATAETENGYVAEKKDLRFWLIVLSLAITAILAALDGTIISTTLPSISTALEGGTEYVWVSGSYFLAV